MREIFIVGLGPGQLDNLSLGAKEALGRGKKIFLRTAEHPIVSQLASLKIKFTAFDYLYEEKNSFEEIYGAIVQSLIREAYSSDGTAPLIYAVPGHPLVGEESVRRLLQAAPAENLKVSIIPGMSFLDAVYALLRIDPAEGFTLQDALSLDIRNISTASHLLFLQVYNKLVASDLKLALLEKFPAEYPAVIIRAAGIEKEEEMVRVPLWALDHYEKFNHLTSVYLEPAPPSAGTAGVQAGAVYPLDPLVEIMQLLLSPQGCPWDREQTHESLKTCLLEEAYEVIEAIDLKDMHKLREELGDLLLQVVFHSALAQGRGDFTPNDVIAEIVEKMIRRHPHVFGEGSAQDAAEVIVNWENIKAQERGENKTEQVRLPRIMKKLNRSAPALLLAEEVQEKARRVGFDWEDAQGAWDKVFEEINELKEAKTDKIKAEEELGDLLFAVVNVARFLQVSPELALRTSTNKFIKRFNYIEQKLQKNNKKWEEMDLKQLDLLWNEAKKPI
ncbi:MAG: nucleoside triphosphate pyrophosphohydrolase [Clostridia bacterium]|nr:nucleoside triphosphate pyrophosphohydrolase [Clostridia bacterium]